MNQLILRWSYVSPAETVYATTHLVCGDCDNRHRCFVPSCYSMFVSLVVSIRPVFIYFFGGRVPRFYLQSTASIHPNHGSQYKITNVSSDRRHDTAARASMRVSLLRVRGAASRLFLSAQ